MDLDIFVHQLHFDTNKAKPGDWEADWEDAPLPYKLYRRLPVFPLSLEIPLQLEDKGSSGLPSLREIGHFLWYVYGLSRLSQSVSDPEYTDSEGPLLMKRRVVASGGGLYPSELYIYLKLEDLPAGVYHYDVLHHRLVLLREGHFDSYLGQALGNRGDLTQCFGIVFVSTMFWKNFFKYYNFSYRLQGLDAGVLMGQLLETAKRFGFSSSVYYQYLDGAMNHLLGLSERQESVYAVIPLSIEPEGAWFKRVNEPEVCAEELSRQLPELGHEHFVRSRKIADYPMPVKMNEASMIHSTASFKRIGRGDVHFAPRGIDLPEVSRVKYDFASVSRHRYSLETDFVLREVSQYKISALLHEASEAFNYINDMDETDTDTQYRLGLYACFYKVAGVPDGAYRYDAYAHKLLKLRSGDQRMRLQQGMTMHNVNLYQVPICLHVAGDIKHLHRELGNRGYRIQQMEAGMLVQRLLLAAAALGMGGRPLLGFEAHICDEIYEMSPQGHTCLIQIPIGPFRSHARLESSLHY